MKKITILRTGFNSLNSYFCKKMGFPLPIRNLNFAVTYRCNSKCLSCDIWKRYLKDNSLAKKELNLNDIKKIFSQFNNLKIASLTGGEPFLRDDIVDIIKCIRSESINISTNGFFTDKIIKACKEILQIPYFREIGISISIDAIGNKHDKLRGLPNSYNNALKTLKELKRLSRKNEKLIVSISNTISKENLDEILKVYDLSKKLGVIFSTRLAHSSSLFYSNVSSKIFVDKKEVPRVKKIFEYLLKKQPRNLFYRYYLTKFLNNPNKQPVPCFSGSNSFFIDPYGNLYPCIMLNKKIGNLKEESLKQLLNSKEATGIRQFIRKGKCSCWTDCEALNSIYLNPIELVRALLYIF